MLEVAFRLSLSANLCIIFRFDPNAKTEQYGAKQLFALDARCRTLPPLSPRRSG